jgi:sirohydrochlorin cobaltochelatase
MEQRPDVVLLIGHGSQDPQSTAEYHQFARKLAEHLGVRVQPCFLEFADPPISAGIEACVATGARRVVALPLFLGPAGHQKNDVPALLNWARAQWPAVRFDYGTPLGAQYPIVAALARRAAETLAREAGTATNSETALLVVGRGSRDPDSNSEVQKIARLLWEGRDYGWVEAAFFSLTYPDVTQGIERCARLGARRVVVLPYLLFTGRIADRIGEQARAAQAHYPNVEILVGAHLGDDDGVHEAVTQRYQEVLAGSASMTCDLCKYRRRMTGFEDEHGLPQLSDHHHGMRGVHSHRGGFSHRHGSVPLFQDGRAASAAPMPAAPLQYDAEGRVAWDQVWTGFCELAIAGGPPHRGTLLEPVPPGEAAADRAGYERVLDELERGLWMVTGLPLVRSATPGWIGLECASEEMALWMLQVIVVENISVRREGRTLFLPAGPAFRLEHEIKNVITAVAKTYHYWQEHLVDSADAR